MEGSEKTTGKIRIPGPPKFIGSNRQEKYLYKRGPLLFTT